MEANGFKEIYDFIMYKYGLLLNLGLFYFFVDAGGKGNVVPAFENLTVARRDTRSRPAIFNLELYVYSPWIIFLRGLKHVQQRQNVIHVKSLRRGGYRFHGRVLNPNEKPIQASAWAIQSFTKPGFHDL